MKASFLKQIMFCQMPGTNRDDFADIAKKSGFKMFCFNGAVYSTNEYLRSIKTRDQQFLYPIFNISDLI